MASVYSLKYRIKKQEIILMLKIENLGVSVEEYLDGLAAAGIDILELKRLEAKGIPTNLALEAIEISSKVTGLNFAITY